VGGIAQSEIDVSLRTFQGNAMTSLSVVKLCGYAPALPTPFDKSGRIDIPALQNLCELQIKHGATALVVCGTTGEAPTLSDAEQELMIRTVVKTVRGRIPVIAGAGSNSTWHAIGLSKSAEAAGADAILSVVPYYNKPTQAGICAHFESIMDASGIPVILYDVPSRTGCGLGDDAVVRLVEHPRCMGLKDATGDTIRPLRLRERLGDKFRLLSGDDASTLGFLMNGGDGCISVTSNVAPGLCRNMYLALRQGQRERATRLANVAMCLTRALFKEGSPSAIKFALSAINVMLPNVRLPLLEPSAELKVELTAILRKIHEGYDGSLLVPPTGLRSSMGKDRGEIARNFLSGLFPQGRALRL
jgi:4-hydroxy-tetrahydrodipicolinate synthase